MDLGVTLVSWHRAIRTDRQYKTFSHFHVLCYCSPSGLLTSGLRFSPFHAARRS